MNEFIVPYHYCAGTYRRRLRFLCCLGAFLRKIGTGSKKGTGRIERVIRFVQSLGGAGSSFLPLPEDTEALTYTSHWLITFSIPTRASRRGLLTLADRSRIPPGWRILGAPNGRSCASNRCSLWRCRWRPGSALPGRGGRHAVADRCPLPCCGGPLRSCDRRCMS